MEHEDEACSSSQQPCSSQSTGEGAQKEEGKAKKVMLSDEYQNEVQSEAMERLEVDEVYELHEWCVRMYQQIEARKTAILSEIGVAPFTDEQVSTWNRYILYGFMYHVIIETTHKIALQ